MKFHDFRLFLRLETTYIRPAGFDPWIYGYERNQAWQQKSVRLLSHGSSDVVTDVRPIFGFGLLRVPANTQVLAQPQGGNLLSGGLEVLHFSDVRMQIDDPIVIGRFTSNSMRYYLHIRGFRQYGLTVPSDLSMSARIIQYTGAPTIRRIQDSSPGGTAELVTVYPPTAFSSFHTGTFAPPPIVIQFSARVSVEREIISEPYTLTWCFYEFQDNSSFFSPTQLINGSGAINYVHPSNWYAAQVLIME
jgi:hypothetical protein